AGRLGQEGTRLDGDAQRPNINGNRVALTVLGAQRRRLEDKPSKQCQLRKDGCPVGGQSPSVYQGGGRRHGKNKAGEDGHLDRLGQRRWRAGTAVSAPRPTYPRRHHSVARRSSRQLSLLSNWPAI